MTTEDTETRRHGEQNPPSRLRHDTDLSESVIAAAIEVHRHFGPDFLESTYHQALAIELEERGIDFVKEAAVTLAYRDRTIGEGRIDLLVAGTLIVELKACPTDAKPFRRQVLTYLKASDLRVGLIINFGHPKLSDGIARVVL